MARPLVAEISKSAFLHNLAVSQKLAGRARVMAVLKADAYGHGANLLARCLDPSTPIALTSVDEAQELKAAGVENPMVLLEGIFGLDEIAWCRRNELQIMVHSEAQVTMLERASKGAPAGRMNVWLKVDTGMHRLGISVDQVGAVIQRLSVIPELNFVGCATHMACADNPQDPATLQQYQMFMSEVLPVVRSVYPNCMASLANSACLMNFDAWCGDVVRPGVMLYGGSCRTGMTGAQLGLKPVMRLKAQVIAKRQIQAREGVGYGLRWRAPVASEIAVVSVGYADGYPRHAPDGTPMMIRGARVPLVGRVSMDMVCADVTGLNVAPGDDVELWGDHISIDEVADRSGTIAYELMTSVTKRVPRQLVN